MLLINNKDIMINNNNGAAGIYEIYTDGESCFSSVFMYLDEINIATFMIFSHDEGFILSFTKVKKKFDEEDNIIFIGKCEYSTHPHFDAGEKLRITISPNEIYLTRESK